MKPLQYHKRSVMEEKKSFPALFTYPCYLYIYTFRHLWKHLDRILYIYINQPWKKNSNNRSKDFTSFLFWQINLWTKGKHGKYLFKIRKQNVSNSRQTFTLNCFSTTTVITAVNICFFVPNSSYEAEISPEHTPPALSIF